MTVLKDVALGRMNFMTLVGADSQKETVGDPLDVQGSVVGAGDPQPRAFAPKLPIRSSVSDAASAATAQRMRRQIRAYMENDIARLQGAYFSWTVDPELNGWLLLGRADVAPGPGGGITMSDWELDISDGYMVGKPSTHRPARVLRSWDRRLSTIPRDYLGSLYSTDFAAQTATPLHFLPVGVSDALGTGRTVLSLFTRQTREGVLSYLTSQPDSQIVNYEQSEANRALGCALIYDRRGISDFMSRATVPASVETDLSGWTATNTVSFDDFSANTIANYRAGSGTIANWTISGGVIACTVNTTQSFKLNQAGLTGDLTATIKVNTGATLPVNAGLFFEGTSTTSPAVQLLFGSTQGNFLVMNSNVWPGWSGNQSAAFTPATNTSYWLQLSRSGTTITGKVFGVDPIANPAAVALATVTATATVGTVARPSGVSASTPNGLTFDDFTVSIPGASVIARDSSWAAPGAGSWSARFTPNISTGGSATLDTPSFAVDPGVTTITPWVDYKVNTITGGNVPLTVHWSDGTSSAAFATLTNTSGTAYATAAGGLAVPVGVTSYTIRAAPSAAGTYDIQLDIPLGVAGTPTRAQVLAANGISGSPQDDLGWEEVYGPNQTLTANDVPVLDNGVARLRYLGSGIFAYDAWISGNGYLELGRVEIWRDYPAGTVAQFTTLVSAAVIEWTEERAVVRATFSGPDQGSRADVYLTLQRGWWGPRIEAYGSWTGGQAMGIAIRLVPSASGASTLGRSSGTTTIVDGTDHGTFAAIENWLYLTQAASPYAIWAAVLQAGVSSVGRADSTAYGSARNGVAITAKYNTSVAGYVSAQLGAGLVATASTDAQTLGRNALYDCRQVPELVGR